MTKPMTSADKKKFSDAEIEKDLQLAKAKELAETADKKLHKKYYDQSQSDVQKTIDPSGFDLKK